MSQTNCSTKIFNSKHLTEMQRGQIEILLKEKKKQNEISALINKSKSCISREINRNIISFWSLFFFSYCHLSIVPLHFF
jgi:hypothetical protein